MILPSKAQILDALRTVQDPDRHRDIVTLGLVQGLQISAGGEALFTITVDPARGPQLEPLRQQAERAVANLPGVKKVTAVLTAERAPSPVRPEKNPVGALPIKKIIAVASGKGGVGKSTMAMNLAVALARAGLKTGLLDADIYGPSQPRMMGLRGFRPQGTDGKITPPVAHGVKTMSIGFMVEEESPLIWRGPMVQSAILQLLRDVDWAGEDGEKLDVLIADLPPGTGDAQLSLVQKVPLAGAVIVSTPQDIALADARKAIGMFRKMNIPVLGLIENMSVHICTQCGHADHIFGQDGARAEAQRQDVPFLGAIPLDRSVMQSGESGRPSDLPVFAEMARVLSKSL